MKTYLRPILIVILTFTISQISFAHTGDLNVDEPSSTKLLSDSLSVNKIQFDSLSLSNEDNSFELKALGFNIQFSTPKHSDEKMPAVRAEIFNTLGLGFCNILNTSYNVYSGTSYGDFLDTKVGKNFTMTIDMAHIDIKLFDAVRFGAGVRYDGYSYVFSNDISLDSDGEKVIPIPLENVKKSKTLMNYIGIPVQFSFYPYKKLAINVESCVEMLVESRTKYKFPKVKGPKVPYANKWNAYVGSTISYNDIGVYLRYSFTPIFEKNHGPEGNVIALGLILNL